MTTQTTKNTFADEDQLLEEYESTFKALKGLDGIENPKEKENMKWIMSVIEGLVPKLELFPLAQCIYSEHTELDETRNLALFHYDPNDYGEINSTYWKYRGVLLEAIEALEQGYTQEP